MRRWTCVTFLVILVVILTGNIFAGTLDKEFNKKVDFISGGMISIENTNGKIQIESWDRESVTIFAEIQVKSSNKRRAQEVLDEVSILVERSGDRLLIKADYPRKNDSGFFNWLLGKGVNVKVDFDIKVPVKSALRVASVNGKVDIVDIEGDCNISTTNGAIAAQSITGDVSAHTTNGSIRIHLKTLPKRADIDLNTVNGGLKLVLPQNPSATVRASTVNGSIHTDFGLRITGKFNSKKLRGELGTGSATLNLKTVNGSIGMYEE